MWKRMCKLDKVKGGKQAAYWEPQTGTEVEKQKGAGHRESWYCAWSEELSPGLRPEPGVCPHFLFLQSCLPSFSLKSVPLQE